MYTKVKLQCIDQTLLPISLPKLASGGRRAVQVEFTFDSLWDGFGKTAIFYRDKNSVHHEVLTDDACKAPWHMIFDPGVVYVGVYGSSGGVVRTSEVLALTIEQGAITGASAMEPTPDVYQQVLAAYGEAERAIAVERARIDNFVSGDPADNTEVQDIRVGHDGKTYSTAGDAVRAQAKLLSSALQSDGGANPLQPLLFDYRRFYTGAASSFTEFALDVPQYNMADLAAFKTAETLDPAQQFAIYARLVTPVPAFQSFNTESYALIVKTDKAFSATFMFGYNPAWGVNTIVSKGVSLSPGYNIIKMDGGLFADDMGYTTYRWVGVFSNSATGSYNFARLETLEMYLVRSDALIGWLDANVKIPTPSIVCWGDSLTAQGGWTEKLAELSGLTVLNAGTGGEPSSTVMARQGADVMLVNNVTIPTDVKPVTLATYTSGFTTEFGRVVRPLLQGGTTHVNPVMIGNIEGTLAWTGGTYNDAAGTWTFTRAKAGEAMIIDRPTAMRTAFDRLHNKPENIPIFFMGTNDGIFDIDDMVNRHRLAILRACADHFLVLGLSRVPDTLKGEYEAAMRSAFGRNFLSLREYLIQYGLVDQGLIATSEDTLAVANGDVPPQLLRDTVHYTDATRVEIGKQVHKRLVELNYI